ncbi:MAG: DUF2490 domain-containing protein [Bryobacteraceae bacterium]
MPGFPTLLRNAIVILSLLPALAAAEPRATDHNRHGWYNYFGDHGLGGTRWGVHLEGQYRRHDFIASWQQLLIRPGVNYEVNPALLLTFGYAYARSYPYSNRAPASGVSNEHRIWEQAQWRYRTGRAALNTRVRFEQRFLGSANPAQSGFRYENRLRTWEQITLPISRRTYFSAYDEVWLYVKPYVSKSAFDQNRAYAAVGLRLNPAWRMEVGYMNQALLHRSGSVLELNHTLVLSVFSIARFKL